MKAVDAIRAQLYWPFVERATAALPELLRGYDVASAVIDRLIDELRTSIALTLDETVLAAVAAEVAAAVAQGELPKDSPRARYRAVFLAEDRWTTRAKTFAKRYPLLYDQMATYATSVAEHISRCVSDLGGLEDESLSLASIATIELISADRHAATWQPLLLTFESGEKRIYKAGDHRYYDVVRRLVELLPVPAPCDVRLPATTCHPTFTLVEHVSESPVHTAKEACSLYANFGALIAVMDALNYCDGHFDNVVRCGTVPVVIDLETTFHSFVPAAEPGDERSILYTGLVGVPPKAEVDEGVSAALQTPWQIVQELGRPFAVADRTDHMQLRYRGMTVTDDSSNDKIFDAPVREHVDDVVSGFARTYESLGRARESVLGRTALWDEIAATRFRQVIRTILYYLHLLRRSQMAEIASSPERVLSWLSNGLSADPWSVPTSSMSSDRVGFRSSSTRREGGI